MVSLSHMKLNKKVLSLIVTIVLISLATISWKKGMLNDYLPFFSTTDNSTIYIPEETEVNTPPNDEPSTTFTIYKSEKESLTVNFDNINNTATFNHPKTGTTTLSGAITANGDRYTNTDETLVFLEYQNEGSIVVNDELVFKGEIEADTP